MAPKIVGRLLDQVRGDKPRSYRELGKEKPGSRPKGARLPTKEGVYPDAGAEVGLDKLTDERGKKRERHAPPLLVAENGDRFLRGPLLAQGGYKKIYLGLSEQGTPVAIAMYRGEGRQALSEKLNGRAKTRSPTAVTDPDTAAREAKMTAEVAPELAPIARGQGQARMFEVMPLLRGSLAQAAKVVHDKPNARPKLEALTLSALAYTGQTLNQYQHHAKGAVLHSDIKPDNLLLSRGNEVVVGDFGLSSYLPPGQTSTIRHAGTPRYQSYETAVAGEQSAQAEVFSLAISGIELASSTNLIEALQQADSGEPQRHRLGRAPANPHRAYRDLDEWRERAPKLSDGRLDFARIKLSDSAGLRPDVARRDTIINGIASTVSTVVGDAHADFLMRRMTSMLAQERATPQEVEDEFISYQTDARIQKNLSAIVKDLKAGEAGAHKPHLKDLERAWRVLRRED